MNTNTGPNYSNSQNKANNAHEMQTQKIAAQTQ